MPHPAQKLNARAQRRRKGRKKRINRVKKVGRREVRGKGTREMII